VYYTWHASREDGRPAPAITFVRWRILYEVSWLTGGVAEVELHRKAAGLRSARLPRLYTATGMAATVSELHYDDMRLFRTSQDWAIVPVGGTNWGGDPA